MLAALEGDLKALLASWFDVGLPRTARASTGTVPPRCWKSSPATRRCTSIRSWRDLKDRLDSDRRCYAFFHPRMPAEPLIFVEVALVQGLADSVQRLLDQKAPLIDLRAADTAIFYSISNCQRGLDGISFGNFLIKRVVDVLSARAAADSRPSRRSRRSPASAAGWTRELAEQRPGFLSEEECDRLRTAAPADRPGAGDRRAGAGGDPGRAAAGGAMLRCGVRPSRCCCGSARATCCWKSTRRGGRSTRWRISTSSNGARLERINCRCRHLREGAARRARRSW